MDEANEEYKEAVRVAGESLFLSSDFMQETDQTLLD
jgi:hypothetical protein